MAQTQTSSVHITAAACPKAAEYRVRTFKSFREASLVAKAHQVLGELAKALVDCRPRASHLPRSKKC